MMRDRQNGLTVRFQDLNAYDFNVPVMLEAHPVTMLMSVMLTLAVLFFLPASALAFPWNCR